MFTLLFVGIGLGVGFAVATRLRTRARELQQPRPIELPVPPPGDRTPLTLAVGDVVQHLDADYVVEGVLMLASSGRSARLMRLADGATTRFLYATDQRDELWLLEPARPVDLGGAAPAVLEHAQRRYRLDGERSPQLLGTGVIGPEGRAARVLEYLGADHVLLVFANDEGAHGFDGEAVSRGLIELLPGS